MTADQRENYIFTHADVMSRILFIYAKLNPGIKYVQGMNEILAVLYYAFYMDNSETLKEHYESDLFFCFTNLMAEVRDRFCRTLDSEHTGIKGQIEQFAVVLKAHDRVLYDHLDFHKISN